MSGPALDDAAWREFRAGLTAYVRRRVDAAAAEDLVGDVLLRLVENQDRLRAANNPAAWVFRVAANAVTDHHRRRGAEARALAAAKTEPRTTALAATGVDAPGDTATGDAATADGAADEMAACLQPFIRGLPAPYAEALLLIEIEGLSRAAAAERLGLSPSGLKSRLQRGRAKLKQSLIACCAIELDARGGIIEYKSRRPAPCCRIGSSC